MRRLSDAIDSVAAANAFSGVVLVDRNGEEELACARGLADRGHETPNSLETQFAIASGTKGLTAAAVVGLVEDRVLELTTTTRSLLGDDLPLIDDRVTIEHLLSHRPGIGDYVDEEADLDLTRIPVARTRPRARDDRAVSRRARRASDEVRARCAYCNSGYVVLALLAERASNISYDLVRQRVCERAEMNNTAFLRSDELPGRAALGYLTVDGSVRTTVFHLPVRGSGDGGIDSTAHDISFWRALFSGKIVSSAWLAELVRPRGGAAGSSKSYGLGFWLESSGAVSLEGCDAGVSFRSVHHPARGITHTVISNTSDGAWPITQLLDERLLT